MLTRSRIRVSIMLFPAGRQYDSEKPLMPISSLVTMTLMCVMTKTACVIESLRKLANHGVEEEA